MANHKSAIKKARASLRKNVINSKTLGGVRTAEKKLLKAITAKSKDESVAALKAYASSIGKAAQKGRIKKETASRKVSRLSRQVSAIA